MDKKLALYDIDGNAKFQTIATSSSSVQSSAIDADKIMIIACEESHFVAFGSNPTATTSSFIIPQDTPLQFNFKKGDKVAARSHNGNGHITILKMS